MTDKMTFPPLRDLPPSRHKARKQHLLSEIVRQPERRRLELPRIARLRLRYAVPAVAVICAAVGAVVFTGALGGSTTNATGNSSGRVGSPRGGQPLGFMPINLDFTRSGQAITSIAVTVNSSVPDGTLQLQVLRGSPYGPDSGRQVVYQEQVPMTNVATPSNGPSGTVALSTWSGTLSPSDWDGGCQNASYAVAFAVVPAGTAFENPLPSTHEGWSEWFTCSSS
jgi:hypothetical protein